MSTTMRRAEPRLRWAILIVLLVVVNFLLVGYRVGECTDYTVESGAESTCTSGPLLGIPGTWTFGVLSICAVAYFVHRIARRRITH